MDCSDEPSLVLCRVAPPKTFTQPGGAPPAATAKPQKNLLLSKKVSMQVVGNKTQYVPLS